MANALGLPDNWFWQVGSIARRFYCLEASPKGSSLERFPSLYIKKYLKKNWWIYIEGSKMLGRDTIDFWLLPWLSKTWTSPLERLLKQPKQL
jgi:hypothetical protein